MTSLFTTTIWRRCLFAALMLLLAAGGCNRTDQKPPAMAATEVLVATPVTRQVIDYEEFTGHTEGRPSVTVRARASGYLEQVKFKEGAEVTKGQVLFVIDKRTYQADYDRALANEALAKAHLSKLNADFRRAENLIHSKSISQAEYDQAAGDQAEAAAAVKVASAALAITKQNLDWTDVVAPIDGRISRQMIDEGNMVKADDTPLTNIVSVDPMHAYFDVDERTMLKVRRMIRSGKMRSANDVTVKMWMAVSDEEGFPHEGTIDFVDNQEDQSTGTLRLRGKFPNRDRLLLPNMFVRVRTQVGTAHDSLMIAERALVSDQGEKYVYVVNEKNEAVYRAVKIGSYHDGLREIVSGLQAGERIVVSGLQRVRPKAKVEPTEVAMDPREAESTAETASTTPADSSSAKAASPMPEAPSAPQPTVTPVAQPISPGKSASAGSTPST